MFYNWTKYCHEKTKIGGLDLFFIKTTIGNSLVVQWLGLHASTAGGKGPIPGQGAKILHAAWSGQNKKKKTTIYCLQETYLKYEDMNRLTAIGW